MHILRGQWMASVLVGAIFLVIGTLAQWFFKAPAIWLLVVVVFALVAACLVAYYIDRKGSDAMTEKPELPAQSVGIHVEGGSRNRVSNNRISGYDKGIVAKNEKGFEAENNRIDRDGPERG